MHDKLFFCKLFFHKKDINDITEWVIKHGVDYIATSFVRKASDIHQIRKILGDMNWKIKIYCKIENQEGIENYTGILAAPDGISEFAIDGYVFIVFFTLWPLIKT